MIILIMLPFIDIIGVVAVTVTVNGDRSIQNGLWFQSNKSVFSLLFPFYCHIANIYLSRIQLPYIELLTIIYRWLGDIILDLGMYFVVPGGKGLSYKRFNFSSYLNPRLRRFQKRTPLIWISRPVLGFNVWVGLFIYILIYLYRSILTLFHALIMWNTRKQRITHGLPWYALV